MSLFTRDKVPTALLFGAAFLASQCATAAAHEGPPYPILVDKPASGYLVSVWGDPDIGTGTFYVILEPAGSSSTEDVSVEISVQPVSGRLPKATYAAHRESLKGQTQFVAYPAFDRQEMWTIGFLIRSPSRSDELTAEVEATPPGYGPWDLITYLVPFLLFGGMWAAALLRRWRSRTQRHGSAANT